jgi:hypothetical protein
LVHLLVVFTWYDEVLRCQIEHLPYVDQGPTVVSEPAPLAFDSM